MVTAALPPLVATCRDAACAAAGPDPGPASPTDDAISGTSALTSPSTARGYRLSRTMTWSGASARTRKEAVAGRAVPGGGAGGGGAPPAGSIRLSYTAGRRSYRVRTVARKGATWAWCLSVEE